MENDNFVATILVGKSPEEALNAINHVSSWWSENIEGTTDELHSQFTHRDRYLQVTFKISQLTKQRIVWDIVNSYCNMFLEKIHEWNGTRIVFDISEQAGKTAIKFTHEGLAPHLACYQVGSKAWDFFITTSLNNFIETGKGVPISKEYASFTSSIDVDKSPEEVYDAVKQVRGWWLNNIQGETDKLNDEFKYYAGDRLQFHFKITEMIPYQSIVWLVINQTFKNTKEQEWKGTTVLFEISPAGEKTRLRFTHLGLVPPLACYAVCQNSWTNYIQISLFNYLKIGEGQPNKW